MIDFYTFNTINGRAVALALAAMRLPHETHTIDIMNGEQRGSEFLSINPSGRIPVIVDQSVEPVLTVSQTTAILIYLAEKSGKFLSQEQAQRAKTIQWLSFITTDIGVNVFNNFLLKALVKPPQVEAANVLKSRALRFCQEIESQLNESAYIAGDELSIADMAALPIIDFWRDDIINKEHPNTQFWYEHLLQQPFVINGLK
ncbi:glutathione S-transferase family protein [Marinicella sp. S1101]|uniref:glutathione S-transferase family protein n=1 Tax=Marinicella marina TaxID=2996016 RepID=UPI002260C07C|nr:glutathione S-transferase family protein [Marinicella marina]MCX7553473.1 glutathione S-transferase family protein [Marinicella marina]MDJ1140097.1 glutathione S-transferase family protein [Marinicella marina]